MISPRILRLNVFLSQKSANRYNSPAQPHLKKKKETKITTINTCLPSTAAVYD